MQARPFHNPVVRQIADQGYYIGVLPYPHMHKWERNAEDPAIASVAAEPA